MSQLLDALDRHSREGALPFHMPGHKRHSLDPRLPYPLDITEIDGFDDLHHPEGILARGMERAAALWGSDRCFYLVGGSTVGLLACIRAAARPGDRVLVARNCHKSVYHGVELCGLRPSYLLPQWDEAFGVWGSVAPQALAAALDAAPDTRLVVLTSPTYEGVVSDIAALAEICHARGAALLADEAHGSHRLEKGAVAAGADLVVQSLHKTLPSLTQTALCHCKEAFAPRVARELNVFETSSPSYPLMASIELCLDWLEEKGPAAFAAYGQRLAQLDELPLKNISILCHCGDEGHGFFAHDPGKLYLKTGWSGPQLAQLLRDRGMEPEMVAPQGVLLMTTVMDGPDTFAKLAQVLLELDPLAPPAGPGALAPPRLPPQRRLPGQAIHLPGELADPARALGRVSGEYLWAYPPGVPFLVPGEEVTPAVLEQLAANREVNLISTSGGLPKILVLAD